jgi:two-component system cell cycle sensor histidine kinase/response regulator CckA
VGKTDAELLENPADAVRLETLKRQVLESGVGTRAEVTVHYRGEPLLYDLVVEPLRDEAGGVIGITCTALDVTARRRAEAQLREAQKMEAIGQLAGGVAHEINNMMTAVIGFGEFVLSALGPEHPQQGDVQEMVRAAERAAGISRQLLAFSRQQVLQPTVLDLNAIAAEFTRMLERVLGLEYALELRLASDLGRVRADRGQVEQVLVNLVLNARDALLAKGTGEGSLVIETGNAVLGEEERQRHPYIDLRTGEYVMLAVHDSGTGMPVEVQTRAFEPFFTTKGVGHGTGLGLSTVYGIVKQSDGYVFLESEPGRGTTVRVYLPRLRVTPPPGAVEQAGSEPGREPVLVVEDEDIVRRLTCRALTAQGYRVLEAANGAEALAVVAARGGELDLVITDVVMPDLPGAELGRQLAEQFPALPVISVSGFAAEEMVRRGQLAPGAPILVKPFAPAELVARVREVVQGVKRR